MVEQNLDAHMVTQATVIAHLIDLALRSECDAEEINKKLRDIASKTALSEIWISDEEGRVEYSSVPDVEFSFCDDCDADSQAGRFMKLLSGNIESIVQPFLPRTLDGRSFKYVAVRGIDKARIVQVGIAETDD